MDEAVQISPSVLPAIAEGGRMRVRRYGVVVFVGIGGLILSIMACWGVMNWQERLFALKLEDIASNQHQMINADLAYASKHIDTLKALVESMDHSVSRQEFVTFSSNLRRQIVGLRATAYAVRVTRDQRGAFEREMRQSGFPAFEIKERVDDGTIQRAKDRDVFFPIVYRDPAEGLDVVLGIDIGREALAYVGPAERRDLLPPVRVIPITLLSDPARPAGFLSFIPVFGKAGSANAKDAAVTGIVFGTFEFGATIENILSEKAHPAGLDIFFFDPAKPAADQLIYWHSSPTRAVPRPVPAQDTLLAGPHWSGVLKVGDREFGAIYLPTEMFGIDEGRWQSTATLFVGLLITGMIVAYLVTSRRQTGQLEFLAGNLRQKTQELRDEADKVTHLANHDAMTGLANRANFNVHLQKTFAAARVSGQPFAVLCFDLDHFKEVNDTLGHGQGDRLLQAVAQRLRGIVRGGDLIGRLGGDEFAIIAADAAVQDEITLLAARINESLANPFALKGSEARVSASIGIAFYSSVTRSPEDLMDQADLALYRSKRAGRNRFSLHTSDLDWELCDRVALAGELQAAIEQDQFELRYQPQVEIRTGHIVGMEALLCWNNPGRGILSLKDFVAVAEANGIIHRIDEWILQETCRQVVCWRTELIKVPRITIDFSVEQLKAMPRLDNEISALLTSHGMVAADIEIEITEQAFMDADEKLGSLINRVRDHGIGIAIDNFGAGYSSIANLLVFRVNRLKIDQQFIRELGTNPADRAIVSATIGLARGLDIDVIATGIETIEQVLVLKAAGCRYAQGNYFSRPVTRGVAAQLLRVGMIGQSLPLGNPPSRERLAGRRI